jgi:sec-independent protein translocase protein TatA
MELVIILLVLVMLFGATRLKDLGGSLGQGIKEFRSAVKDDEEEAAKEAAKNAENVKASEVAATEAAAPVATNGAEVVSAVKCPNCGALNDAQAKHCNQCGAAIAAPVA